MRRVLPYPLLALTLLVMWLVLNRSMSPGHILLGSVVAVFATQGMRALRPERPRIASWRPVLPLARLALADVVRSNITVGRIILSGNRPGGTSGFIRVPLAIRNRHGQAVLAALITATPGTLWVQFDPARNLLLVHILDRVDEEAWRRRIKERYEPLLMSMFE